MFESKFRSSWDTALAQLEKLLDDMQTLALHTLPNEAELDVLHRLETQKNRIPAVEHRLIADVDARGIAHEHGCRSTSVLLAQLLRINPPEAGARLKAATDLGPRLGLSGEGLPPLFEQVAAAQAVGDISPAHARVIIDTVDGLPEAVQAEHDLCLQQVLVEQAHTVNPMQLGQIARAMAYVLDQDGTLVEEHDRNRHRDLRIKRRADGSACIEGELTAICAEALLSALEPLAAPAPAGQDGAKDPRTAGQRLHDALLDATLIALRSQNLPHCGGVAATILLHMTPEHIQTGTGLVATGHGIQISAAEALSLFGDARIFPVILDDTGEIKDYGPARRIYTEGQRLAMIARDHGCSFPGCTQPPSRCQSHHITDYSITRRTSVHDGTLLCGFHHREHPKLGWTCRMISGTPHWTPPRWLDPQQTPRRNQAHVSTLRCRAAALTAW
ncbi:MAG: HNH endonuclease [Actinomycetota bacterium]|nr:HNH endonuclease [Actinomycetota bacterium]